MSGLITIVIGAVVAFIVPEWIKFGDKKSRSLIQLICNIIGILIIISGALTFLGDLHII